MKKLRVGVVGCGGIANGKHLPAMKRNGNFEIVAFCDLIEERAQKAKKEYGTEDARVYTDYTELLKEDVEAVYVLTPNSAHAPVSIAAMEAGKNVMYRLCGSQGHGGGCRAHRKDSDHWLPEPLSFGFRVFEECL